MADARAARPGRIQRLVEGLTASQSVALSIVFIVLVALADHLTGTVVAFSVFYLLPVSLTAWKVGRAAGLAMAMLAAITWGSLDWLGGHRLDPPILHIWNPLVRLGFFVVVTLLLARMRELYAAQVELARTDSLTGAANRRTLVEAIELEIARSGRTQRPFTIACADLDGFKQLNDRHGHAAGDEVLVELVAAWSARLRRTDLLARPGGDEFVVLLPETGADESAKVLDKLAAAFRARAGELDRAVDVTIGAVSFNSAPRSAAEALQLADDLLVECKRERKGSIGHAVAALPAQLEVSRLRRGD